MEGFSISLDLSKFYQDCRASSLIFVDTGTMTTIKHVENRIRTLFGLDFNVRLFSNSHYLPSKEDVRLLSYCKKISVEQRRAVDDSVEKQPQLNICTDDVTQSSRKRRKLLPEDATQNENVVALSYKKQKKKKKRACHVDDSSDLHSNAQNGICKKAHLPVETVAHPSRLEVKEGKVSKQCSQSNVSVDLGEVTEEINASRYFATESVESLNGTTQPRVCEKSPRPNITQQISTSHPSIYDQETSSLNSTDCDDSLCDIVKKDSPCLTSPDNQETESNAQHSLEVRPKRKRVRKRKNKSSTLETVSEPKNFTFPEMQPLPNESSLVATDKTKHIFFPDEEVATGKAEEASVHVEIPCVTTPPVSNEENNAITPPDSNDQNTATTPEMSKSAKQSIGRLLSLLKSDMPPVFGRQRKTPVSLVQPPPVDISRNSSNKSEPAATTAKKSVNVGISATGSPTPHTNTSQNVSFLKSIPQERTKISFKILKMSSSYCPELSSTITAVVEKIIPETKDMTLRLLSGAVECQKPKGKFDLDPNDDATEESFTDTVQLNWNELIEPVLCQ